MSAGRPLRGSHVRRVLAGTTPLTLELLERIAAATRLDVGTDLRAVHVGQALQRARRAAGLTQAQAAAGILRPEYLSLIEQGRRRPAITTLQELASRVNADLGPLLALPLGGRPIQLRGNAAHRNRSGDFAAGPPVVVDVVALGAHLRALRVQKSCSVRAASDGNIALAKTFYRLERGAVTPTLATLARYATAVGIDLRFPLTSVELGRRLQRRRRELGLSLDAVAHDLGGRAYVRRVEAGIVMPSLDALLKLAGRLHLDVGPILSKAVVAPTSR